MSEHTPGPLVADGTLIRAPRAGGSILVAAAEWADVDTDTARANAAHITLAWNAHDDLLAACRGAEIIVAAWGVLNKKLNGQLPPGTQKLLDTIQAAIAKAEV